LTFWVVVSWFIQILLCGVLFYLQTKKNSKRTILLIGHRGSGKGTGTSTPENTIAAFERASLDGIPCVEFDVQLTKDGVPVIFHDSTLQRCTNGSGLLKEHTLSALKKLDAGNGQTIPTFEELIRCAKEKNLSLLCELKHPSHFGGQLEPKVISDLEAQQWTHKTIIQSFDFKSLDLCHKLRPNISFGALFFRPWNYFQVPSYCEFVCPMGEILLLNPWILLFARLKGQKVVIWFVFLEKWIVNFLVFLGVDGIITDNGVVVKNLLNQKSELTSE